MRTLLALSVFVLTCGSSSFAGETCSFKAIDGGTPGVCSDETFSVALWVGDAEKVKSQLEANPALVHSCHHSLSYAGEWVNPLVFSICHGVSSTKAAIVATLLRAGASAQVNCESDLFKLTALKCAQQIEDKTVKNEVVRLLKAAGANR